MPSQQQKVKVYLLGRFFIKVNDSCISNDYWKSKKSLTLFKYFCLKKDTQITKEKLIELLWPGSNNNKTHNLHTTIYYMRRTLKSIVNNTDNNFINYSNGMYWLNSENLWFDNDKYVELYKMGKSLENKNQKKALLSYKKALSLYRGDFFKEELYIDWTRSARQQYREYFIDLILRTSTLVVKLKNDYNKAIDLCKKGIDIDPFREELYKKLISYLIKQGNYIDALNKYREYSEDLYKELGLYPGPETQKLFKKISILENKNNIPEIHQCDYHTFVNIFNLEIKRQERTNEPFLIMIINLHDKLDKLRGKIILNVLKRSLRKGDLLNYYQGEKILLQIFNANNKIAQKIKERLENNLKNSFDSFSINYYVIKPNNNNIDIRDILVK